MINYVSWYEHSGYNPVCVRFRCGTRGGIQVKKSDLVALLPSAYLFRKRWIPVEKVLACLQYHANVANVAANVAGTPNIKSWFVDSISNITQLYQIRLEYDNNHIGNQGSSRMVLDAFDA
jgi:hypothetical protein